MFQIKSKPFASKFSTIILTIIAVLAVIGLVKAATLVTVTDSFNDTTKVASNTNLVVDTANGQVYLAAASSWTCGSDLVDSRDAKTYTTSLIGSQCWMSQNLNVGTKVAGSATQGANTSSPDKYCYNDDEGNCTKYGGFYQWNQMMGGLTAPATQGICPTGWHIPTHDEFTTLERTVCTSGSCSTDFPIDITTTGWRGTDEGTTLKDPAGPFKGLLAGNRNTDGSFGNLGTDALFWSSSESGGSAWGRNLYSGLATVSRYTDDKAYGFSVRCLKN